MLIIAESLSASTLHAELVRRINALTLGGSRAYLFVPEQQTVASEAQMAAELPESAPLTFEVTNFTRFTDTVFRKIGGIAKKYADAPRKSLLMWRTLTELRHTLDMTKGVREINDGVVKKALSAVAELESHSLTPEDAEICRASDKAGASLKRKLSDAIVIRQAYKALMKEQFADSDEELTRLADILAERSEILSDTEFFLDGFTSFTEPQYKIIARLAELATVTVFLPLPRGDVGFEYGEIFGAKERLVSISKRRGADIKLQKLGDYCAEKPPILAEASKLLWRTFGKIDNEYLQNTDKIRIFEATTPFEECDFIAADIKRRVMEGGAYSDFAIIARRCEKYLGVLDSSLEKAGIPHFMSKRRDAAEFEAIKFIYAAYAAASGLRREDVIAYMKCGFLDICREELDEFELYAQRWQISGARFTSLFNMNPDGYTARWREEAEEELVRINRVREELIAPLVDFGAKIRGTHTVREHSEYLFSFIDEMKLESSLTERARRTGEVGYLSIFKIISDALDTLVEVLGEVSVSPDTFLSQLKTVISAYGIGKIPAGIDEVTIGDAAQLRINGKKHIYLLGVNRGEFPAAPKDESFFNEKDKAILSSLGLSIEPDLEIKEARELFSFSRAFGFADEDVTILYSLSSTDFTSTPRAEVIGRLAEISDGKIQPQRISELPIIDRIYSPYQAHEMLGELSGEERLGAIDALRRHGYRVFDGQHDTIDNGSLTLGEEALSLIYGDKLSLTQSRIDAFVKCPLSYFLRYNLKLDSGEVYEMDYSGVGSYVHAVLENFFGEAMKEGLDISDISKERLEELTLRASKRYLGTISGTDDLDAAAKISLSRLYRTTIPVIEDITAELRGSKFRASFFELGIGRDKTAPDPVVYDGNFGEKISVYGQIDRVDTYKHGEDVFVKVIDYKTGSKKFSRTDLADGENLQMFLYLKAIVDTKKPEFLERLGVGAGGRLIPAGVVYIKTGLTDVKVEHDEEALTLTEIKKNQGRDGMVLNDPISLGAMSAEYLPVKFKKDGTPTAASEGLLYAEGEFDDIMEEVRRSVTSVAERMQGGEIRAIPKGSKEKKTPCEYCEYKPICRKAVL